MTEPGHGDQRYCVTITSSAELHAGDLVMHRVIGGWKVARRRQADDEGRVSAEQMAVREQITQVLFAHPATDHAADTAPEIAALCESAADAILTLLRTGTPPESMKENR